MRPALPTFLDDAASTLAHTRAWVVGSALGRQGFRFLAAHTGLPALVIAAILVVVGFRLLRKTARFAAEVAVVAVALVAATELGWIQW